MVQWILCPDMNVCMCPYRRIFPYCMLALRLSSVMYIHICSVRIIYNILLCVQINELCIVCTNMHILSKWRWRVCTDKVYYPWSIQVCPYYLLTWICPIVWFCVLHVLSNRYKWMAHYILWIDHVWQESVRKQLISPYITDVSPILSTLS